MGVMPMLYRMLFPETSSHVFVFTQSSYIPSTTCNLTKSRAFSPEIQVLRSYSSPQAQY